MQTNKVCSVCHTLGHSKFYCKAKPIKQIARTPIKIPLNQIRKPKNKPVKKKAVSRSQLVRKLDSVFSQWVRLNESDKQGLATCVTCGDSKPWKEMQNGHFFSRGRYPTRWSEDNCHVQDYRCNVLLKGNYINYTLYMVDRYGRPAIDDMERLSRSCIKTPTPELRVMIEDYTKKVHDLS